MFTFENFFKATAANFTEVSEAEAHDLELDYYSSDHYSFFSGSTYWYRDGYVYRLSNHWGCGVASCNWLLDGKSYGMSRNSEKKDRMGKCKLSDFLPASNDLITDIRTVGKKIDGLFIILDANKEKFIYDGELEIIEINKVYIEKKKFSCGKLSDYSYTRTESISNIGRIYEVIGERKKYEL